MHELHPFTDLCAVPGDTGYDPANPLKIVRSYFDPTPWIETGGLDYVGGTTYAAQAAISFPHTLGETITAIASSGLALIELREFAEDIAITFAHLAQAGRIPLSYSLIAVKLATPLAV
jgi:hypothetical protein